MAIIALITPLNIQQAAERVFRKASKANSSLHDYLNQQTIRFNSQETERQFYRQIFQLILAPLPMRAQ